jgi:hypothetical protein
MGFGRPIVGERKFFGHYTNGNQKMHFGCHLKVFNHWMVTKNFWSLAIEFGNGGM